MGPTLVALLAAVMLSAARDRAELPCATARHHEFDFVLGNWLVRDSLGQAIGTATFSKAYSGCVLIESWLGVGRAGQSLGIIGYQAEGGRWHREFLDSEGALISLDGGMEGATMIMTGKSYPGDGVLIHRLAWTSARDGAVEERWQTSADAGRTWRVKFYGVFHRISE